ncbi:M61 family metallopeptidase [Basilea psittacipulmonis]|uniref:Peptidase M61 n=1 Tax=Basilea psittacipulmonis DSM 24701 TaxID=1072685 RepID=A0A077DGF9_9BURK|nr:PDZ domain-containing protein [Basilea psittacipulmonis]AIL32562.1 peptidase M61 [Basilea psittacipulmonis DSM 24701]
MNLIYTIKPIDLAGHRFHIQLDIHHPDPREQLLKLPAWIPGSYMIRDFSKHIEHIEAVSLDKTEKKLKIEKLNSHTWAVTTLGADHIKISYTVYACDTSIRSAYLDEKRGFFNGSSVFLAVDGKEQEPCWVHIQAPEEHKDWKVYTTLPEASKHPKKAKRHHFGMYQARHYDDLIDHPVELGTPHYIRFKAHGVLHEMVFSGIVPNLDLKRIADDCKKICEYEIAFFDPQHKKAPFLDVSDRYLFITFVTGNDYGGLEHRSSTALLASRYDLPVKGQKETSADYIKFLGLVSHEYFHTWHVKRIKPQAFVPYQLQKENHTRLLWIFEGFTSYYDDLILYRTGLISQSQYHQLMQKNIQYIEQTPGRYKMSLAESSFDAWTKYYKQDENARNSLISYYTKGAVVAWLLDLFIQTNSAYSLDDVMRHLWQTFGQNFFTGDAKGLTEDEFADIVYHVTGVKIHKFLDHYVYGTKDLPYNKFLKPHQLKLSWDDQPTQVNIGITYQTQNDCVIQSVLEHSDAHRAGLSAGDTLVAIDGIRVKSLDKILQRYQKGDTAMVHAFRRDELREFKLTFTTYTQPQCRIQALAKKIDVMTTKKSSKK